MLILKVFLIIAFIVWIIVGIRIILRMKRDSKVEEFRNMISNMCYDYAMRNYKTKGFDEVKEVWNWFDSKWTYDEMLKSSKPLTLEAWYTPEEIKKINE